MRKQTQQPKPPSPDSLMFLTLSIFGVIAISVAGYVVIWWVTSQ